MRPELMTNHAKLRIELGHSTELPSQQNTRVPITLRAD